MTRRRLFSAVAAILCTGVLLFSVLEMAERVAGFNTSDQRTLWMLKPVQLREFRFADRPVRIDDVTHESAAAVRVSYGDQQLVLPETIPAKDERLPGLARHQDWMQLIRFADMGRDTTEEFERKLETGEIRDRLTIVIRRPLADDPRTLGQGWKKQWVFDFYEFLPEGGFATETWAYPSGRTIDKIKPGQLQEGTWQYSAALAVMPKLRKPNPRFGNDALHAMEWTLPAAAFSGLGLLVAVLVFAAPQRRPFRPE